MKPIFLFCALVIVPLNLHSASKDETRSEKIQQFKTNQECMQTATATEDWAKLVPCSKRALELIEDLFDSNHPNVATMAHEHGLALDKHGGYRAESEQILKSAVKKYEKIYGKNSPELVDVLFDYAEILSKKRAGYRRYHDTYRRHGMAVKTYLRALNLSKNRKDLNILDYADRSADTFEKLSRVVRSEISFDQTKNLGLDTLKIYQQQVGETHFKTAKIALNIGKLFLKSDTPRELYKAIEYFKLSLMNEKIAPYGHGFLIEVYERTDQMELSTHHLQNLATLRPADSHKLAFLEPVYRPRDAYYPPNAKRRRIEGYAIVTFTVDQSGQVNNAEVLEEHPGGYDFGLVALKEVKKFRYLPMIRHGKFVESPRRTYQLNFKLPK